MAKHNASVTIVKVSKFDNILGTFLTNYTVVVFWPQAEEEDIISWRHSFRGYTELESIFILLKILSFYLCLLLCLQGKELLVRSCSTCQVKVTALLRSGK